MSKYWKARQEKRENLSFDKGTEAYKEYVKILEQAKENINTKIAKLYANHSIDTGLSKAESMKIIQGKEYKEWRYKIEDYVKQLNSIKDKSSIEFKKLSLELETLASRSRINRLESLKADIDIELIRAGVKANYTMDNTLTKTYIDTYKSLVDDLSYKNTIDINKVKKVMSYDWSGANYSKRIWSNTESLAKTIKSELLVGLNQGINYKIMSKRIADKFETSKKNAERLVRTEINYIHNQATADSYKDTGIEKYQFLATLDSRTSQTCASLNGEIFEVKNITIGINYPPMHPRCRSTTIPIIDYASLANIKEDDFEEKDIDNSSENGIIKEKKEIKRNYKILDEHNIHNIQSDSDIVFKNINDDIKESLRDYTTGGYTDINRYLSGQKDYDRKQDVDNINKAMESFKLKDDMVVFRGTYAKYYESYKQGDVFSGNIFYSTSVYEEKARGFYNDIKYYDYEDNNAILLEIRVPKNTKSLYIGNNTSFDETEGELLLSNKLKYKFIENKDNRIVLEVVNE